MNLKEHIASLKIDILTAGFEERGVEWDYRNLRSPFSRLYLITDGETYVTHNGQRYYLSPGTIHLIPCFSVCSYKCYTHFKHYYIHFTSRLAGDLDIFSIGKFSYQLSSDDESRGLFERLFDLFQESKRVADGSASSVLRMDGIMRLLISPFLDTLTSADNLPSRSFIEVLDYIEKNLDHPLTLDSLAKIAALHPNYFSDRFYEIFGVRPIDYLNRKRIEKAQIMILSDAGTLKEIAGMTGFRDPAYFSRIFTKYSGTTPGRYKSVMHI